MSGVHTRFREDGGDDDASDSSIEDFSASSSSFALWAKSKAEDGVDQTSVLPVSVNAVS